MKQTQRKLISQAHVLIFFSITEEIIWYLTFCQSTENKKCDIINFLKEQKTIAIHTDLSTQAISN